MSNPTTNPAPDPTLEQIARTFVGWECWKQISGMYSARLAADHTVRVQGESRQDLADEIARAVAKLAAQ